jgi:hypothetical protein
VKFYSLTEFQFGLILLATFLLEPFDLVALATMVYHDQEGLPGAVYQDGLAINLQHVLPMYIHRNE